MAENEIIEVCSNEELPIILNELIDKSGYKKLYLSEQLGIAGQNFKRLINKKNLSLDELNKILSIIGYDAKIEITKKD